MSYVSIEFMIFLPVVFLLYWFVVKKLRWQNFLVLVASYIFYGWWDWRFLFLIIFTSAGSFFSGLLIKRYEGYRTKQKIVSATNIVVNLLVLGTFKYYNFFVESLVDALGALGFMVDWPTANIVLPIGISFYTFQALSYSIDVYKNKLEPTRDIVAFLAFISFFPQLVAGPIERATNLLPQFLKPRQFDYAKAVDGCRQMLWGFFKKMVIADGCATIVNSVWGNYDELSGLNLIVGGFLFSFQVYCDFSGYSDIAIGCARLFGVNLMANFKYPYFARSIPDFWRRWHISLMSWFRDYVYFPMGGSRCPKWRTVVNNISVFVISGLWHGANWKFVLYGLFHGAMCSSYVIRGRKSKFEHNVGYNRLLPSFKELRMMIVTFTLVTVARILFRAQSLGQAFDYIGNIFSSPFHDQMGIVGTKMLLLCCMLLSVEWIKRNHNHPLELEGNGLLRYRTTRWILYIGLGLITLFCQAGQQNFIYFQF